jgi:hypothetical protein
MFDAAISIRDIKRSYAWQAVQDVSKEVDISDSDLYKKFIKKYGGHFAKILKVFGQKFILIYFNNENDLMKALLDSGMEDELGQGLKIKNQNELIGKNGTFISRLSCRQRSRKNSGSENEDNDLFSDAEGGSNDFQETININDSTNLIILLVLSLNSIS